jgi:hypothetical protein
MMSYPAKPIKERFWAKVDKTTTPDGCWTWLGCDGHGYGYFGMYVGGIWKRVKGSLIAWEFANDPEWPDKTDGFSTLSEGMMICHRCNNSICVRPDHLYAGTSTDNNRDTVKAGHKNSPHGEEAWDAKLTWEQVREIRNLYSNKEGFYRKATVSQRSLAKQFGVSRIAIRKVLSHSSWKEKYNSKGGSTW